MSSRYRTLNLGRCALIKLYSSIRASTSVEARIHSTLCAAIIMVWVRGCSGRPQYEANRFRRESALPT